MSKSLALDRAMPGARSRRVSRSRARTRCADDACGSTSSSSSLHEHVARGAQTTLGEPL
jgi:hypothetical protein